jgi:hypothetical protein
MNVNNVVVNNGDVPIDEADGWRLINLWQLEWCKCFGINLKQHQ